MFLNILIVLLQIIPFWSAILLKLPSVTKSTILQLINIKIPYTLQDLYHQGELDEVEVENISPVCRSDTFPHYCNSYVVATGNITQFYHTKGNVSYKSDMIYTFRHNVKTG